MVQIFTPQWWFAFLVSVTIGVLGKFAYDLDLNKEFSFKYKIKSFGKSLAIGLFLSFSADNLIVILEKEKFRFIIIPLVAYSAVYILDYWKKNNSSIFKDLIYFILFRKKNENNINTSYNETNFENGEPIDKNDNSSSGNSE